MNEWDTYIMAGLAGMMSNHRMYGEKSKLSKTYRSSKWKNRKKMIKKSKKINRGW